MDDLLDLLHEGDGVMLNLNKIRTYQLFYNINGLVESRTQEDCSMLKAMHQSLPWTCACFHA